MANVKIEDGETANGADKNEEIKPKNAVKKTALKPGQKVKISFMYFKASEFSMALCCFFVLKHPTPTSGAGDRVFYETLLRQNPKSIMAQEWCLGEQEINIIIRRHNHNMYFHSFHSLWRVTS